MIKCKYYRASEIEMYTPECSDFFEDGFAFYHVHPSDIEGKYCQFCGGKIKFKEFTEHPLAQEGE
jgi:hypothetical protein